MGVEWKSRDAVIEEPGRRIVQEQTRTGGQALPWLDMTAFLRGAIDLALDNHANAPRSNTQWVFFDRGLIDAAASPLDQFRVELAMIHSALSRHGANQEPDTRANNTGASVDTISVGRIAPDLVIQRAVESSYRVLAVH